MARGVLQIRLGVWRVGRTTAARRGPSPGGPEPCWLHDNRSPWPRAWPGGPPRRWCSDASAAAIAGEHCWWQRPLARRWRRRSLPSPSRRAGCFRQDPAPAPVSGGNACQPAAGGASRLRGRPCQAPAQWPLPRAPIATASFSPL